MAGFVIFLGVALFLAAGDVRWAQGWAFMLVFFVLTAAAIAYLWRTNPDIFVARSRIRPGTKGWDKVLMVFLLSSFLAIFPVAGLDAGRFHWSSVPLAVVILGYVLLCVGFFLSIWVYRVNKFAEPSVRIQTERGHKVIDTGPYAIVRHPLYLGALLCVPGFPWPLAPFGPWCRRRRGPGPGGTDGAGGPDAARGTRRLQEYAGRVRYRLIPGVW